MSALVSVSVMPARDFRGSCAPAGDKSLSHRYAMLAALAEGRSTLHNFATGDDCARTLACLAALGCEVRCDARTVTISGGSLRAPAAPLDCGNSGTTMRLLAGVLAAQPFRSKLVGDASLSRRPMRRILEPLAQMGATAQSQDGFPPLTFDGRELRGIEYTLPVPSAQVKSCVLLAGLHAQGETRIIEPVRTRDHTEIALRAFGAEVQTGRTNDLHHIALEGGQHLHPIEATIPGDISTAAFFLCAAALFPESNLVSDAILLNPTRAAILDVLRAMGLRFQFLNVQDHHGELAGTIQVRGPEKLRGVSISGALSAALIDELPVLAAIAPYTEGGIEIRDAAELRVKETDRLTSVAQNLRAMGAEVEEFPDGLRVPGGQQLRGAELDSCGDHRIAMAFAVAALRASGPTTIHGADAVAISCPEFFELLNSLAVR